MALESTARKQLAEATPLYRTAPHNIELEQALLGAILVNNEAFYRVSDFLEPRHFFEPIHQKVYEVTASLVRVGKAATPITLKTFLPPDIDVAGLTVSQYLARLAAEATTVINAADYGRTIYDLALRRALIGIGEDLVNTAMIRRWIRGPRTRSRRPNAISTNWRRPAATTAGSSASPRR
jgi:replicative DNA helicase